MRWEGQRCLPLGVQWRHCKCKCHSQSNLGVFCFTLLVMCQDKNHSNVCYATCYANNRLATNHSGQTTEGSRFEPINDLLGYLSLRITTTDQNKQNNIDGLLTIRRFGKDTMWSHFTFPFFELHKCQDDWVEIGWLQCSFYLLSKCPQLHFYTNHKCWMFYFIVPRDGVEKRNDQNSPNSWT